MHWAATGRDNRGEVTYWARLAGHEANAALSPEDAIHWFRTALDATDEDERRLDLLIALGSAQRWADAAAFRQTLLDAAALAERLSDDDALIRAALANNRGGASRAGTVDVERVAVLERALEVVGSHDSTERACLLATLALELSQGGDWERRLELADAAVSCARRLGDEATLLRVLLHTTEATRLPGNARPPAHRHRGAVRHREANGRPRPARHRGAPRGTREDRGGCVRSGLRGGRRAR